jgi:predicted small lipoprotein YifL
MVFRIFCMDRAKQTSVAGTRHGPERSPAATLALALSILAAGCGQKGPLELPKAAPAASSASAAAK